MGLDNSINLTSSQVLPASKLSNYGEARSELWENTRATTPSNGKLVCKLFQIKQILPESSVWLVCSAEVWVCISLSHSAQDSSRWASNNTNNWLKVIILMTTSLQIAAFKMTSKTLKSHLKIFDHFQWHCSKSSENCWNALEWCWDIFQNPSHKTEKVGTHKDLQKFINTIFVIT